MSQENNHSISRIFIGSLKSLIREVFKLCAILLAWCMKIAGLALTKTGEAVERIIVKKS